MLSAARRGASKEADVFALRWLTSLVVLGALACAADSDDRSMAGGGKADDPTGDASAAASDAADAAGADAAAPTALRFAELRLVDPAVMALGIDVTPTVNDRVRESITLDKDPIDGLIDFSNVLLFRPYTAEPSATTRMDIVAGAACTAPVETTSCRPPQVGAPVPAVARNGGEVCLQPLAGTATRPVATPAAPCFASEPVSLTVPMGGLSIPLQEVRLGATYADDQLVGGLLSGFLPKTVADATILPTTLPLIGGRALATVLKATDRDVGPGGVVGWWFYLSFSAVPTAYGE